MPEFSIKPKHVNITNTILDEMAPQLKVKSNDLWTYFFPNIHKVLNSRYPFAHNIRTDGVSVSIFVENRNKIAPKEEPKQKKKTNYRRKARNPT